MVKLDHIHVYTYSRSFLIQIFICAHTNTFSRGSGESTLDERYLLIEGKVTPKDIIEMIFFWYDVAICFEEKKGNICVFL